jgi:hypothetical protein
VVWLELSDPLVGARELVGGQVIDWLDAEGHSVKWSVVPAHVTIRSRYLCGEDNHKLVCWKVWELWEGADK